MLGTNAIRAEEAIVLRFNNRIRNIFQHCLKPIYMRQRKLNIQFKAKKVNFDQNSEIHANTCKLPKNINVL